MTANITNTGEEGRGPQPLDRIARFPSEISIKGVSHEELQRNMYDVHKRLSIQLDFQICGQCDSLRYDQYVDKRLFGLKKVLCKMYYCSKEGCTRMIGRAEGEAVTMNKGMPSNCVQSDKYRTR